MNNKKIKFNLKKSGKEKKETILYIKTNIYLKIHKE